MSENMVIEFPKTMKVLGVCSLLLGIVQIGISAAAYSQTSWNAGAWWAGSFAVITSLFAMSSSNRSVVLAGCTFSSLTIALLIAGLILDGVIFANVATLKTCAVKNTLDYYGDSSYIVSARSCALQHSQTCACVRADDDLCYLFNLRDADDCGVILNKYPSLLLGSILFMVALIIVVGIYSGFTCKNLSCPNRRGDNTHLTGASADTSSTAVATPAAAMATPVAAKGSDML